MINIALTDYFTYFEKIQTHIKWNNLPVHKTAARDFRNKEKISRKTRWNLSTRSFNTSVWELLAYDCRVKDYILKPGTKEHNFSAIFLCISLFYLFLSHTQTLSSLSIIKAWIHSWANWFVNWTKNLHHPQAYRRSNFSTIDWFNFKQLKKWTYQKLLKLWCWSFS